MVLALERPLQTRRTKQAVIDCDIHISTPRNDPLGQYMSARWRRHHEVFGGRGHSGAGYPRMNPAAARTDSWPPNGDPPGSDLAFLQQQLLDTWGIEYGVINWTFRAGGQLNLEYGAALARAANDWQIAAWLEPEPRLRASLIVPYEDGDLAAAEIDRLGDHPGFVQIILIARTAEPLGRRKYWKMYEAAERHGLPIGIHFGGEGGGPITGAGFPSFYYEDHAGMPPALETHVVSFVCEGVFERFPALKVVLIEGGMGWLPPLMWRLDRAWSLLREEVPHLTRPPSEYVREHFWLTTQPMEEPPHKEQFAQFLEHLDMDDRLMFATDYPHWDFDSPADAVPASLPPDLQRKIMAENARALYGLEPRG
jgi:uncharacterized protein